MISLKDDSSYRELYEELGEKYPQGEMVRLKNKIGTRYWTVLRELEPFALSGSELFDIGCNDGVFSIPFCLRGGRATGIDISENLVLAARKRAKMLSLPKDRYSFFRAEIDSEEILSMLDQHEEFDVVLFSEVLEHLLSPDTSLRNIHALMKEGGTMLLTTPTPLFETVTELSLPYLRELIDRRKLLERNLIETTKKEEFSARGITNSSFRHDGYYPLALRRYLRRFGFKCQKAYTIQFPHRSKIALYPLQILGINREMMLRRIPFLNLLGSINVLVCRKVS
jgi:2-polyprenyl-3-methyl-5-hydroxy-6-metoxy-1,4-benzoquinol methylase